MSSVVEQIKDKLDIVSVLSSYIPLEKAGNSFKGRCPFHHEKTPSFFVSQERQSYYCFGCQAKGDIFTFVGEFEGLSFVETLKYLGEKAGVPVLGYKQTENKDAHSRLYTLLEDATLFFNRHLTQEPTISAYLSSRGLSPKTIQDFRLGYARAGWRDAHAYLLEKGYTEKEMYTVGLIKSKEGGGWYDLFRERIMFPISDSTGRVIAFSGRTMRQEENIPKYLNSPETVLFNKSKTLFGFDKAKKDIRLRDYTILVEGQMDLLLMHQAGFTNTVASSGTALTTDHLTILQRLSPRIIFAFDSDGAGFKATDRSAQLALSLGMEVKAARFPQGKDPADMVRDDVDGLKKSIAEAKHIIEFYTESLLAQRIDPHKLSKELYTHVLPYIALLHSTVEQNHFIKRVAEMTYLKEEALWEDLKKVRVADTANQRPSPQKTTPERHLDTEKKIIGLLWFQESKEDPNISSLQARVKEVMGTEYDRIEQLYTQNKDTLLFEIEAYYNNSRSMTEELHDLLSSLEEEYLKRDLTKAMTLLQQAEQLKDHDGIHRYLKECQDISQKIHIIKQRHEKTK